MEQNDIAFQAWSWKVIRNPREIMVAMHLQREFLDISHSYVRIDHICTSYSSAVGYVQLQVPIPDLLNDDACRRPSAIANSCTTVLAILQLVEEGS